jgi:sulfur-carrier protein
MAVTFLIPAHLAALAANQKTILVEPQSPTVRAALEALWQHSPALRDRVVDEQGEVRQHINIFVGAECIRFVEGLATPAPEGSEISIVPAVSGG